MLLTMNTNISKVRHVQPECVHAQHRAEAARRSDLLDITQKRIFLFVCAVNIGRQRERVCVCVCVCLCVCINKCEFSASGIKGVN